MFRDESGATSIEYALIGSLIAVAILASVTLLGEETSALYELIAALTADAL